MNTSKDIIITGATNWSANFWLNNPNNDEGGGPGAIFGTTKNVGTHGTNSVRLYENLGGIQLRVRGASNMLSQTINVSIDDGNWHMITVVYDGSRNWAFIYVNGTDRSNEGSYPALGSENINGGGTGGYWTIHAFDAITNNGNSTVDEFAWYNRTLNQTDINELWNGGAGFQPPFAVNVFETTAEEGWTNTNLSIFNITINNATDSYFFNTSNGTIITNVSSTSGNYNITYNAPNMQATTHVNYNVITNLHAILDGQTTNFTAESTEGISITNFTIISPAGAVYTTTTGSLIANTTINPVNYSFNNSEGYYNTTDQSTNVVGGILNHNTAWNLNIDIQDAGTGAPIVASFTYNGNPYSGSSVYNLSTIGLSAATRTVTFSATGYTNEIALLTNTGPTTQTITMNSTSLGITFSENTSGFIYWGVEEGDINTADGGEPFTNVASLTFNQSNISIGDVVVVFNPGTTGYQQRFVYYNDGNTTVEETLFVENTTAQQSVRVQGDGPIEHARVCAFRFNGSEWQASYCDFTDVLGYATLLLASQQEYRFIAQHDDYTPAEITRFIPPTSSETIVIEMEEVSSTTTLHYLSTTCTSVLLTSQWCNITVIGYNAGQTITFTYLLANESSPRTLSVNGTTATLNFIVDNTTEPMAINISVNNVPVWNGFYYINDYLIYNATNSVDWGNMTFTSSNGTLQNYLDILSDPDNETYLILVYIMIIIVGLFFGVMIYNMFEGVEKQTEYASLGMSGWFLFIAITLFPIFWIGVIGPLMVFAFRIFKPMLK